MNQYIITEEQLKEISTIDRYTTKMYNRLHAVRSHPHNPQAEREKVLDNLDEWLNSDDHLSFFKWEARAKIRELRQGEQE